MVDDLLRRYRMRIVLDVVVDAEDADAATELAVQMPIPDPFEFDHLTIDSIEDVTDKGNE